MKYLNGQWWYSFNTGDEPIRGYAEVLRTFADVTDSDALDLSTASRLQVAGRLLSTAHAYDPPVAVGPIEFSMETA
jgi:hypothetical protein